MRCCYARQKIVKLPDLGNSLRCTLGNFISALTSLRTLLHQEETSVIKMISSSLEKSTVAMALETLLYCLRDTQEVQNLCWFIFTNFSLIVFSECLGYFGAVDPARIGITLRQAIRCEDPGKVDLALRLIRDFLLKILTEGAAPVQVGSFQPVKNNCIRIKQATQFSKFFKSSTRQSLESCGIALVLRNLCSYLIESPSLLLLTKNFPNLALFFQKKFRTSYFS